MPKDFLKLFLVFTLVVFISGCGVRAKRYVQVRDRVDLQPAGNAGYLTGKASPEETKPVKTTRKVYVLEFAKDDKKDMKEEKQTTTRTTTSRSVYRRRADQRKSQPPKRVRNYGNIDSTPEATQTGFVDYTIKKGDTLQKISKQFYDGYSKWPRIHNANKEKIKDPNRLKVGTVIKVPVYE